MEKVFLAHPIALCGTYVLARFVLALRRKRTIQLWTGVKGQRSNRLIFFLHALSCVALFTTAGISCATLANGEATSWWASKNYLASVLAVALFFLAGLLPDADDPYTANEWNAYTWIVSFGFEAAFLLLVICRFPGQLESPAHDVSQISLSTLRICLLASMLATFSLQHVQGTSVPATTDETEQLLGTSSNGRLDAVYGTSHERLKRPDGSRVGDAQTTTWLDYAIGFKKLFPFLWPSDSRALQARAIFCFFLLVTQRAVNILVPHQLGVVVAALGPGRIPYKELSVYIILRGLQGQQGVIGSIRALLWIPISQSTYLRLTAATFEHVLYLSLDFHLSKRIGEVMSALGKGSALNTFLDGLAFQLFPMVADLWIAAAYFIVEFDFFYALAVIFVTWTYLYVTIYMAKYRGRARREMAMREREMDAARTDALMSYETVHHNGAVPMEMSRFRKLVTVFQRAEYSVFFSLNLLNAVQNGVFTLGVMLMCYLDAFQISRNQQKVAMFVTLLTYLAQLQAPLNFFGSFYTQVQNNLVDAERMLDLFNQEPAIADSAHAEPLRHCDGNVSFKHVSFAYDNRKPAVRNVSFEVQTGTSTAIVGESGGGKSTILKLLFRFYDVDSGCITIDGQDVRDITLKSFRSFIGIVPQDTVLFNDTLMYNLLYSKPNATEEEVHAACKAASIHDKIMAFPQGYDTPVGERGLKLSGGEKQRIAIARTFLRAPRILLLDEATASLDSQTELQIQSALENVSKGRTTITIAHRLSTITNSDQIIVLREGEIVEKGTHSQLLSLNGVYSQMWDKQTRTNSN